MKNGHESLFLQRHLRKFALNLSDQITTKINKEINKEITTQTKMAPGVTATRNALGFLWEAALGAPSLPPTPVQALNIATYKHNR